MKIRFLPFAASLCLLALAGYAADLTDVPVKVLSQKFESSDSIVIDEVVATSRQLKVGDTVIVRGHYQLHSRPKAALGFFLTTKGRSGPSPVSPRQRVAVKEGSGTFELEHVVPGEGRLHVSFYPGSGGSSFGEVYFGPSAP